MIVDEVIQKIKNWNDKRIAQQKSDALWNKLHRYHKDGKPAKFKQKDAIAAGKAALKKQKESK